MICIAQYVERLQCCPAAFCAGEVHEFLNCLGAAHVQLQAGSICLIMFCSPGYMQLGSHGEHRERILSTPVSKEAVGGEGGILTIPHAIDLLVLQISRRGFNDIHQLAEEVPRSSDICGFNAPDINRCSPAACIVQAA